MQFRQIVETVKNTKRLKYVHVAINEDDGLKLDKVCEKLNCKKSRLLSAMINNLAREILKDGGNDVKKN